MLENKQVKAYLLLFLLIICGLATATITAEKVVHIGVDFPFSNIIFSIFTYPLVDCICELWGKKSAQQAVWFALFCQMIMVLLLQLSILAPHAKFWIYQKSYQIVLSSSFLVIVASFLAFFASQILDILVFQKIRNASNGKHLWLRSNLSTFSGQIVDSSIFVFIVFWTSNYKLTIFFGSLIVKMILSVLMTPFVYLIVIGINRYLDSQTLAFRIQNIAKT